MSEPGGPAAAAEALLGAFSVADFERTLQRWCRPQALPEIGIEK